ncbi:MAG: response regulator transcription factor [Chitinophagaceae bacterium]|nr:response regulator transcription factor [Chitinophagaceae bacterium]
MITAIALDDEPLALKAIEKLCKTVDFISLEKTFTEPGEAMKHLRKFQPHLLFLDIKMPSVSGLNFCKAVQQNTMVIFTTAFSEYAADSYELNAIDYLLKPISAERFKQAAEKANDFYKYIWNKHHEREINIYLRSNYSLVKIPVADILYIEGISDYVKVFSKNQKMTMSRISMKAMLEKLPGNDFIRVHRSFIIPFHNITSVRNKTIFLTDIEIPIGNTYEEEFFKRYA